MGKLSGKALTPLYLKSFMATFSMKYFWRGYTYKETNRTRERKRDREKDEIEKSRKFNFLFCLFLKTTYACKILTTARHLRRGSGSRCHTPANIKT